MIIQIEKTIKTPEKQLLESLKSANLKIELMSEKPKINPYKKMNKRISNPMKFITHLKRMSPNIQGQVGRDPIRDLEQPKIKRMIKMKALRKKKKRINNLKRGRSEKAAKHSIKMRARLNSIELNNLLR